MQICLNLRKIGFERFSFSILTILLGLFLSFNVFSQDGQLRFNSFSTEQGLSHPAVFSIAQDQHGYMWFATLDGLNKYDGYNFKTYRPDPLNPGSISDLGVQCLFNDSHGNLWVTMAGGKIDRYDPLHDQFIHYSLGSYQSRESGSLGYLSIAEALSGQLWVSASIGKIFRYDPVKDRFCIQTVLDKEKVLDKVHIVTLYADRINDIWIGTREGVILRFNPKSGQMERFYQQLAGINDEENAIQGITENADGQIWFATEKSGILIFDPKSKTFTKLQHQKNNPNSLASNKLYCIFRDSKSQIWIGTVDCGIDIYDPQKKHFSNFSHNTNIPWSLTDNMVMCCFEDKTGGVWIGTYYGGANLLNNRSQGFSNISYEKGKPGSLVNNPILAICEDHTNTLWVGTDGGGLNRRLKATGKFENYFHNPGSLGSNLISTLLEDQAGILWIGTDIGQLIKYDPKTSVFSLCQEIPQSNNGIVTVYEDKSGELWIGTVFGGLFRYNPVSKTVKNYVHNDNDPFSISGNFIYSIFEDQSGDLWIGVRKGGLNKFARSTGKFTCYANNPKDPRSLSNNTVFCTYEDSLGYLWLGTWGGGLNKFDRQRKTFQYFTVNDGLPGNIVYSVLPDNSGNLWLTTNKGLCKFNTRTFTSINFDPSDGLLDNSFNQGAYYKGKDGRFYYGTSKGITVFHPDSIKENLHIPPIVLTKFSIFDKPLETGTPIDLVDSIKLMYNQNFFSFEFVALDYTAPHKNLYAYMLEGVDKRWVYNKNRRFGSYTNISPGTYKLKIKGSNNDGKWNEVGKVITIIITPPFWQTWWFRALVIILFFVLLYSIHRYRVNRLLEIERTRNRIARDLHDEVSATLTGIAYFSNAIELETRSSRTPMLQKLVTLIQESATEAQEAMSDIVWSINPDNDDWKIILPKFRRFASDLFDSKGIRYTMDIPVSLPYKSLNMEPRRNLWLIYKELVTNTVKHSHCTEVTIKIYTSDKHLHLLVADNGQGFNANTSFDGNGVKNIKNRVKSLNGLVQLITAPGDGTRWEITIPL